jgi:hypothetical protein
MKRVLAGLAVAVGYVLVEAPAVMAQIVQSDAQAEPATSETTQLVTSNTEVRRAVLGLLVIAGVVGLVTILYWYKTGQQARDRFARLYSGRHLAGQGEHDVVDPRGHWATDAAHTPSTFAQPVYASGPAPPPTAGGRVQTSGSQPSMAQPGPTWDRAPQATAPTTGPTWETQRSTPPPRRRPEFFD